MRPGWLGGWILWCAAAECLGIGAAALHYGAVLTLFGEPEPVAARVGVWLLLALAAVPEGLVLGGIQGWRLRQLWPDLSARAYVAATIAVGLVGWGTGSAIPLFLLPDGPAGDGAEPGLLATLAYAGLFGLGVGLLFGLFQAAALPRRLPARWRWIAGNMAGWGLGLPLIYAGASLGADLGGWGPRLAAWALGGAAAGLAVGAATGAAAKAIAVRAPAQGRAGSPLPVA